jgi:hypothetical protein
VGGFPGDFSSGCLFFGALLGAEAELIASSPGVVRSGGWTLDGTLTSPQHETYRESF